MTTEQYIHNINKLCAANDFTTARNLMEANFEEVVKPENYLKLSREGYALYKIILTESNTNQSLSRLDVYTISQINKLANNFDIAGLRTLIKNSGNILERDEVRVCLTAVAKSVLTSMGHQVVPSEDTEKDSRTQFIEDLNTHNNHSSTGVDGTRERRTQPRVKTGFSRGIAFHSNH